jgi:glycosyltransferase involved in cell wall biosynthesis
LIEEASLTLMPSRSEGLPIAALESQALGRPVVATPVGGLPEAVIHGQTGLVVPPEQLTSAVESLLADPARLVRLGRAAREHVRRSFPWSKTLDGYERLYRVLEGGRRRSR